MMSTNFRKQQLEHAMTHDLRNQAMRGQTHPHAQAQFAKGGEQMAALRPAVDKKPRGMERVAFHEVYGVAAEALPAARDVPGHGADGRRGGFVVSFDEEFGEGGHPCKAGKPCACGGSCGGESPAERTPWSAPAATPRAHALHGGALGHAHPQTAGHSKQPWPRRCPVPPPPSFPCSKQDDWAALAVPHIYAWYQYFQCLTGGMPGDLDTPTTRRHLLFLAQQHVYSQMPVCPLPLNVVPTIHGLGCFPIDCTDGYVFDTLTCSCACKLQCPLGKQPDAACLNCVCSQDVQACPPEMAWDDGSCTCVQKPGCAGKMGSSNQTFCEQQLPECTPDQGTAICKKCEKDPTKTTCVCKWLGVNGHFTGNGPTNC